MMEQSEEAVLGLTGWTVLRGFCRARASGARDLLGSLAQWGWRARAQSSSSPVSRGPGKARSTGASTSEAMEWEKVQAAAPLAACRLSVCVRRTILPCDKGARGLAPGVFRWLCAACKPA